MRISSDSIGNKGIKKLIQLHMPNLTALTLSNTNITTDTIKVIKKTVGEGLCWLGVTMQNNFRCDQLLKDIGHFKLSINYLSKIHLMSSFIFEEPTFMYLGRISKICLNSDKLFVYISSVNWRSDWKYDMMVPEKIEANLKCVYKQALYN